MRYKKHKNPAADGLTSGHQDFQNIKTPLLDALTPPGAALSASDIAHVLRRMTEAELERLCAEIQGSYPESPALHLWAF